MAATLMKGAGSLNGDQNLVRNTGADGIAQTVFTLGPEAGLTITW